MYGIAIAKGANNCCWNIEVNCTNWKITGNEKMPEFARDHNSKQHCPFTILAVHLCPGYEPTM